MGSKKQQTAFFSFKNDDTDLVELGQFIRDTTGYRVEREWYIIFTNNGTSAVYSKTTPENMKVDCKNPDLILIDKNSGILKLIIELDGDIHRIDETSTNERNEKYEKAGLPYLVIPKWEIETTIFDYVSKRLEEVL